MKRRLIIYLFIVSAVMAMIWAGVELTPERTKQRFMESLEEPDTAWETMWSLSEEPPAFVLPKLMSAMKSDDPRHRAGAARVLGNLIENNRANHDAERYKAAVPVMIEALKDGDKDVRRNAAFALGELRDGTAFPKLIEALRDSDGEARWWAADAIGKYRDASAVPPLIEALKDPKSTLPTSIIKTLGALGDKVAVPALIQTLERRNKSGDWPIREEVAKALGNLGDKSAAPALVTALKDNEFYVRRAAAQALGALGDKSAIPALKEALKDDQSSVRREAAEALIMIKNR